MKLGEAEPGELETRGRGGIEDHQIEKLVGDIVTVRRSRMGAFLLVIQQVAVTLEGAGGRNPKPAAIQGRQFQPLQEAQRLRVGDVIGLIGHGADIGSLADERSA